MFKKIKSRLYFPIAFYFRFWAQIQLFLWKPRIIVVTGSSGKTTLLNLIESQMGNIARYSHKANSSFGIPFDILGLKRTSFKLSEWPFLFLLAPLWAFKSPYKEKIYVVEADCDRPYEGKFLASLLKPEVCLLISLSTTHSVNFDREVVNKKFKSVNEAIAFEFGFFLEYSQKMVIVNGDSDLIKKQLNRTKAEIKLITDKQLKSYTVSKYSTLFKIDDRKYEINALLPKEAFYSIEMTHVLTNYFNLKEDKSFSNFKLPKGRGRIFKGIKQTTLIDSTYNATFDGMTATLNMFDLFPSSNKIAVLGDMIELGSKEKEEHEKLANVINSLKLSKVILVGPRMLEFVYPNLNFSDSNMEKFVNPKEALDFLENNLKGGEVILFKGARFLEGVIEQLLLDKNDIKHLVRREKVWDDRRKKFGI